MSSQSSAEEAIERRAADLTDELVAFRRDLHAHPEVARTERRTSERVAARLREAGLSPAAMPGTGLVCDIPGTGTRTVALRADLDALPVTETSGLPFASGNGLAHACGHDIHTTAALGAALILGEMSAAGTLAPDVRMIFQPAEEVQPGGALDVVQAGLLTGFQEVYALHCEPKLDVGRVGSRIGAITSASDTVHVSLSSPGGHTSRPHLTADLVYAVGLIITQTPALLGRRVDPRTGVNLTWGAVTAGVAPNAIPASGSLSGTLRCLDASVWQQAEELLAELIPEVVAGTGVTVEVNIVRGVPPVMNAEPCVRRMDHVARRLLGPDSVTLTEQSLGGEDFGWYLQQAPGAMARLGTRAPGGPTYDLHQGDIVFDEGAIGVGVRLLAGLAALPDR